jgi:RNA polymerase sigma-70 factor, ECF subfamily
MSNLSRIDDEAARSLLLRVGQGCETSFESLFRLLSRRVFAFVCRSISNQEVAKEIMLDTMYEVWHSADRYRSEAKVSTWVLGIARNKVLMSLRSRRETEHEDIDEYAELVEDESTCVFDEVAGKEAREMVVGCMQTLTPAHRECLHLLHFEDMSVTEIAQLLAIPDGTVKTRLMHARNNLLRCVKATIGDRHGGRER